MKDLYRKSALEKIASPDQLDKAPKITSPLSWLSLMALTVVVIITLAWSIWGEIPETVSANGMVLPSSSGINTVYSSLSGRVTSVMVSNGSLIRENTPVMVITPSQGDPEIIRAGVVGYVTDIVVKQGDEVKTNGDLIRVAPETAARQVIACYVPTSIVRKVRIDMDAYVTLDSADSQTYGHMQGRVVNIDGYSTSGAGMSNVLGTDNNIAANFTTNSSASVPVSAVTVELYPDAAADSGFWWSNEKGALQAVSNGSMCSVRIIIKEIAPIEKLLTKIKEVWGEQ